MNEHLIETRKSTSEGASLRRDRLIVAICLMLAVAACQPMDADKHFQTTPDPSLQPTASEPAVVKATEITSDEVPATSEPAALQAVLCVPPGWGLPVSESLEGLSLGEGMPSLEVIECQDPAVEIDQGRAHLAFVPGDDGLVVGSIHLAMVVPFGSAQESLALDQAQQVLDQGASSIEVVDWREVSPDQIVLRVDGTYPGDADYPLIQPWSLLAEPKFDAVASALAPGLSALLSDDPVVRLAAAGDVMLDRKLGDIIASGWVEYPLEDVAGILASANLAIGNLESALGDEGQAANKGFTFRAPAEAAETLAYAGFDVLSLANNHTLDYGERGLMQSIDLLREQEIVAVGAGFDETAAHMPFITEIDGLSVAFLAYVDVPVEWMGFDAHAWAATPTRPGVAWADPERIRLDVGDAAELADLVIVLLHSGNEFIYEPSPAQVAAAHAAIDAGAHLVLGHHAQVIQGLEFYEGGVIAYGLGNLAYSESGVDSSLILNVWLDPQGVRSLEIVPLQLLSDGHPILASGTQANRIHQLVIDLSTDLR
jgi:hypothetical protein